MKKNKRERENNKKLKKIPKRGTREKNGKER